MEKYIYDKNNGLWYELQGDYYIPCLVLDKEDTQPEYSALPEPGVRRMRATVPVTQSQCSGQ